MSERVLDRVRTASDPLFQASEISHTYAGRSGEVRVLDRLTFDLRRGEFLAIVGPSGCGKTTLLRLLGGLIRPSAGRLLLEGIPLAGPHASIGVVFQDPVLMPWRTVFDNVMLPVEVAGLPLSTYRAKADELLGLVGLSSFGKSYPWELSGGMQQRVAIARALITDPALLLLDEPFGALDAMTREALNFDLLRICAQTRKTTLFITHNIIEAVLMADRVMILSPRPARIVDVVAVKLPERTSKIVYTPEFGGYVRRIEEGIRGGGARD